jgi:cation transport ATPase
VGIRAKKQQNNDRESEPCIVYSILKKTALVETEGHCQDVHAMCFSGYLIILSHNVVNVIPDILFDGLRAFKQGSPNMNSLVGFGSAAAFAISAVSGLIICYFLCSDL